MAEIDKIIAKGKEYTFKKDGQTGINKANIKSLQSKILGIEKGAFVADGYLSPAKLDAPAPEEDEYLGYDAATGKFNWKLIANKAKIASGEVLEENQVINGTFDVNSDWAGINRSIAGGKGIITVTGGSDANLNQTLVYDLTAFYVVKMDVQRTSGTGGSLRVMDNASNNGGLTQSDTLTQLDGTVQPLEFRWQPQANSDKIQINRASNVGDYTFTVDNVTVQKVSATSGSAPDTPTSPGEKGDMVFTTTHGYVCVDTNLWKRWALEDNWSL